MDPPPPASEQPPTPYPSQWPAGMQFTPSSMQADQAAAFASFFQQYLLAQQPPTPIHSSAGVVNPKSVFDSFANSHPPSSQPPSSSEYQPPSIQDSTRSTQGINRKAPNWKVNEDVALCESWIRVSDNPFLGNGQANDAFWSSIWREFKLRVPGTKRVQRACENRWSIIQGDITKWRAIVRRVHSNKDSGANPNHEWVACMVVFKEDHGREFKFFHCWDVLRCCTKWQISTDEKESRDANKGGGAGTGRERNPNPPYSMPSYTISGSSSPGLDSFDDSCPDPDIDIPKTHIPTSGTPYNLAENTSPPSLHPKQPVQRPLGRKSSKEKCQQMGAGVSESSSAARELLNATVSAWRHSSETRFESLKQTAEEQAFHAIKNARLDSVLISIKIIIQLAEAEKELLPLDPNFSAEQELARRLVRMRELEELDKEHKEIRALEYSPRGQCRRLNK